MNLPPSSKLRSSSSPRLLSPPLASSHLLPRPSLTFSHLLSPAPPPPPLQCIPQVITALSVPLLRPDGKPCGVLLALNRAAGRRFAREDEATARNMGLQGGSVLYNLGKFEEARAARDRNDALLHVTRILNSEHRSERLVQESLQRARSLTDAERGALFLCDAKTKQLYSKLADGATEIRFPMRHGVAGWAATNAQALTHRRMQQQGGEGGDADADGESERMDTGYIVNIKNAYEDQRFNPDVDKRTGFMTRNTSCACTSSLLTTPC